MDLDRGQIEIPLLENYGETSNPSSSSSLPSYETEKPNTPHDVGLMDIQYAWKNFPSWTGTTRLGNPLTALIPSFLQRRYDYKTRLSSTSWLDGLRGTAAFIVFLHHFTWFWFPVLSYGYGSAPEFRWFFQWPFIRLFYSGRGMVSLFFVISGYVLSYSTLRKIRAGNFVGVLDTLASATFRRWLRLFLPILASTFVSMLLIRLGWYEGYIGAPPRRTETFWQQVQNWWLEFIRISDPFQGMDGEYTYSHPYSPQLWTIPREMRGSIVTYVALLCLAKTRQAIRVGCMVFFCWYVLWIQQWDLYLFLGGTLLAELDLLRADYFEDTNPTALLQFLPSNISRHARLIMHTLTGILTILALHLLTFPDQAPELTPGYRTLYAHAPAAYGSPTLKQRYWLALGATLLVFAMSLSPSLNSNSANNNPKSEATFLQRPFNSVIAQYLGKISFGLYLMHEFVLFTIGSRILNFTPTGNMSLYCFGYAIALVVNTAVLVWISDLFWRGVDVRSVEFAKKVGAWCFIK